MQVLGANPGQAVVQPVHRCQQPVCEDRLLLQRRRVEPRDQQGRDDCHGCCGKQPPEPACVESKHDPGQVSATGDFLKQLSGDEKTGDDEEYVHSDVAAGDIEDLVVVEDDGHDRNGSKDFDVGAEAPGGWRRCGVHVLALPTVLEADRAA